MTDGRPDSWSITDLLTQAHFTGKKKLGHLCNAISLLECQLHPNISNQGMENASNSICPPYCSTQFQTFSRSP